MPTRQKKKSIKREARRARHSQGGRLDGRLKLGSWDRMAGTIEVFDCR